MGIKSLMVLIKRFAPNSIKYKTVGDYNGLALGVDANLMLYKMVYAIRKNGYDIMTDGEITTHIHATLLKLIGFRRNNIIPVFVFDGMPPKIKEKTLKDRKVFQKFMKQKYSQAITQDEQKKYYYMKSDITEDEIDDMKTLIELFGYTVIDAPEEADSQLGYMSQKGMIDGVITDDMDILLFGGKKLLKNFSIAPKKKFVEIDLEDVKKELGITQKQLIDIGILLGCDYCPSAKGFGPVNSYKMIKKHKNIKNLRLNIDYDKTQNYFRKPTVQKNIDIKNNGINKTDLTNFLKELKYDDEKINKIVHKIT